MVAKAPWCFLERNPIAGLKKFCIGSYDASVQWNNQKALLQKDPSSSVLAVPDIHLILLSDLRGQRFRPEL